MSRIETHTLSSSKKICMILGTVFILLITILISLRIYHKKKIEKATYPFILGGFAATYSMVASPTFPERSLTGVIVYFIVAIVILIYDLEKINRIYKFILVDICIILSIIFIVLLAKTLLCSTIICDIEVSALELFVLSLPLIIFSNL